MALPPARLLDELATHGNGLADALSQADLAVPGTDWTVRDVVVHTGAVHRWAADIVRRRLPANQTGGSLAFHPDPAVTDDRLAGWLRAGLGALVDELQGAPEDLDAWTFARGLPPRHFWIRRQAHETAIHRADVEYAHGNVTDVSADFAQDGIDELVTGFARQRAFATDVVASLALHASDGDPWSIRFGGERIDAVRSDAAADATVTGTSAQLYRWVWNRPVDVTVSGDPAVVELWRRVRI